MPSRDVIVVGASAGGVQALKALASVLASDLPAAVIVVLHRHRVRRSILPDILGRSARLPVSPLRHGDPVRRGRILVAPGGCHLLFDGEYVRLHEGPTGTSIDAAFDSAAHTFGERTVGVILSGMLVDGSAGLRRIKEHGGAAVIQHPDDATFPGMPLAALEGMDVDYLVPVDQMGQVLSDLARGRGIGRPTVIGPGSRS